MKIYLAAGRQMVETVKAYTKEAQALGIEVTSKWALEEDLSALGTEALALMDLADIRKADVLIHLTSNPSGTGGAHTETGYALALGKKVMIVGPRINTFHTLKRVSVYENWEEVLNEILDVKDSQKAICESC